MNLDIMPIFLIIQKIFFIACSLLYLVFSIIAFRQVTYMARDVKDKFNPVLISISFIQLIFAVFVLFLVIIWL